MKLYYSKGSCSLAVRISINELGLDADYEMVDLKTKKTESGKDFLTINPKGVVPVLELNNGVVLTENAVIQQYLADTASATKLLPSTTDFKRYRVLEWLNFTSNEMHKCAGIFFNPMIPQNIKDEVYLPILKAKLTYIDNHLANNKYLMGEEFTLPDGYLFVVLSWLKYFNINLADWPNAKRYHLELQKRPSVVESLKEEGIAVEGVH